MRWFLCDPSAQDGLRGLHKGNYNNNNRSQSLDWLTWWGSFVAINHTACFPCWKWNNCSGTCDVRYLISTIDENFIAVFLPTNSLTKRTFTKLYRYNNENDFVGYWWLLNKAKMPSVYHKTTLQEVSHARIVLHIFLVLYTSNRMIIWIKIFLTLSSSSKCVKF